MKKLASLMLSLLICLSLSTYQAKAIASPESAAPPVQAEVLNPNRPDEPGIMPLGEEVPVKADENASNSD